MKLQSLKAISLLLHYPDQELVDHIDELKDALQEDKSIKVDLRPFFDYFRGKDCFVLGETYVALFDCGRGTSLYLFEHVHGQSRDRGQAMVNLKSMYEKSGFDIPENELPDYLPIFLEYLSQLTLDEAKKLLTEVSHLVRNIGEGLAKRGSYYYLLCSALLELSGEKSVDVDFTPKDIAVTPSDYEKLDKEWAEEPVTFNNKANISAAPGNQCEIRRHPSDKKKAS